MGRPYDLKRVQKFIDKSIPGMSYGFNDPTTWMDTGCYALNYMISNDFFGGIPLEGKITMIAGDSGSGKSYLAANLTKWCQNNDVWVAFIDTENAGDSIWFEPLGIKTGQDHMDKFLGSTVDDISKFIGNLLEDYNFNNKEKPYSERPKMLIIVDSVGMLITPTQENQFMAGDQKGDMGVKAKQLTTMLRVLISKIGAERIGIVLTNHVYDSQDKYLPDQISGGKMVEFSTSVLIQLNKYLLKEEDGRETKDVKGVRSTVVVRKSRYAKPFEKVKIDIPYETGMDPYSGLFDLFDKKGVFERNGAWYSWINPETGEVIKRQGSSVSTWKDVLDEIMKLWKTHYEKPDEKIGFDETGVTEDMVKEELNEEINSSTDKKGKKK